RAFVQAGVAAAGLELARSTSRRHDHRRVVSQDSGKDDDARRGALRSRDAGCPPGDRARGGSDERVPRYDLLATVWVAPSPVVQVPALSNEGFPCTSQRSLRRDGG